MTGGQLEFDCGERWLTAADVLDDDVLDADVVPQLGLPRPATAHARRTRWRPTTNLPPLDSYEETL